MSTAHEAELMTEHESEAEAEDVSEASATPDHSESASGEPSAPTALVERTEKGTFAKGVSGNPKGRAKGSKNAITLRRLETEEALRDYLAPRAKGLLKKAMAMAMAGDTKMMSVLLDKMLSSLRNEDVGEQRDTNVNVVFSNLTSVARDRMPKGDVVEGEVISPPIVRITHAGEK